MSLTHRAVFVVRSHWNHWPFQEVWLAIRAFLPLFASIAHLSYRMRVHSVESYAAGIAGGVLGIIGTRLLIEVAAVRGVAVRNPGVET